MSAEPNSILIVDDEELNSEGLARRLQGRGFAVTAVKSGEEAIELLGDRRFDLVLLDIMMPEMTGPEVLRFLRRADSLIDLPIIMVTAKRESEDVVEALELGANDYVTKPLDFPVVLARIRTQLALRRAVSQITELEQKLDARNKELQATATKLATANERMAGDLGVAARVQQVFLPALPPQVAGARFAWTFKPCSQPAGDFLNAFWLDDRHLELCVLHVEGHGVAVALLAVAASQLLARLASPRTCPGARAAEAGGAPVPPAQVAGELSKHFSDAALGQHLTFLYGILGLSDGDFRFISAGHPGPVHLPWGASPFQLEVTDLPVGAGARTYKECVVNLRPGDRLVLYTDGVTDAPSADGEHFGMPRFLATLEQGRGSSLDKNLDALLASVEGWRDDTPRHHDISILLVERTDPAGAAAAEPGRTSRLPSRPSGQHPVEKSGP
jgi:sigma-B regulation protein RsbU (phosphoserine phosphatase)